MNKDCVFCHLKESSLVTYSDFYLVEDLKPQANTHLLLISIAHFSNYQETPTPVLCMTHNIVKDLTYNLGIKRFKIVVNNVMDQLIDHLHIHILSDQITELDNLTFTPVQEGGSVLQNNSLGGFSFERAICKDTVEVDSD